MTELAPVNRSHRRLAWIIANGVEPVGPVGREFVETGSPLVRDSGHALIRENRGAQVIANAIRDELQAERLAMLEWMGQHGLLDNPVGMRSFVLRGEHRFAAQRAALGADEQRVLSRLSPLRNNWRTAGRIKSMTWGLGTTAMLNSLVARGILVSRMNFRVKQYAFPGARP